MSQLHIVVLALVQGITEFLPVSSWSHLILVKELTGWPDHGLVVEMALHLGTLGAVVVYFWRDLWAMAAGLFQSRRGRREPSAHLFFAIVVGTLPVVLAGYLLHEFLGDPPRTLGVIGVTTLVFGLLLYLADKRGMTVRRIEHLTIPDAFLIGCAQVIALIPGASRSGITMTAGRFLGFERRDAARFSFLLSIPASLGAGVLSGIDLYNAGDSLLTFGALEAIGLAFVAALLSIHALLAWLNRRTFTPFVIYRVILGVALIALAYGDFWT